MTSNLRPPEDVKSKMMSEEDLLKCVIDMAHVYGWKVAHFRPARMMRKDGSTKWVTAVQGDGKGFPDLVMVRYYSLIFAELKSQKGNASTEQLGWLTILSGLQINPDTRVFIWRPSDWLDGTIEKVLSS